VDIVFFAGPVILRDTFKRIDWFGRDVRIVPIQGAGSSYFSALADQLRDSSGRILPALVRTYAKVELDQVDQIALAAYSAGHGLLNKVADVDADRARLSAMVLSDATFSGFSDPPKRGYVAMGSDAARGERLFVSTASNSGGADYLTGRKSWLSVWNAVQATTGRRPRPVVPKAPAPSASGGWWRMGAFYWADYVVPGSADGAGNDYSHAGHHDLAPLIWQAYLAPWFARTRWLGPILGGAVFAAIGMGAYWMWSQRKNLTLRH
jgi:hypothetical protein